MKTSKIINTILQAVGFGMGVAVLVLHIMSVITPEAAVSMLAIGLVAMGLSGLKQVETEKE